MSMFKKQPLYLTVAFVAFAGGVAVRSASLLGAAPSVQAATPHTSVAFIVNAENPQTEFSIGDLRRMLLGEVTRWSDGRKITMAMREPGSAERDAVLQLICRMNEADFTRYLLHAAYRGESQAALKQLDTSTGVRRFVFNVPGAIGYVRADEVDQTVKVIRIVGTVKESAASGLTLRTK
jgi:ABC-type phosphate transport system substrate-binding protein